MQSALTYAIEFTAIGSVLFFGSLFVSGLISRYRPTPTAQPASQASPQFIPNPDGFPAATVDEATLVEAHQAYVAQYWAARPTDNVVPFVRSQTATAVDWSILSPYDLRKACQTRGIRWRNAHGKNKHLSKAEMIAALSGLPEQVA
jgi:hypothetical protein